MSEEVDELLDIAGNRSTSPRRSLDLLDASASALSTLAADPRRTRSTLLRARALRALGRLPEARAVLGGFPGILDALNLSAMARIELESRARVESGLIAFLEGDLPSATELLTHGLEGRTDAAPDDEAWDAEGALACAAFLLGHLATARRHVDRAQGSGALALLATILIDLEVGGSPDAAHRAATVARDFSGTEFEALAWCVEAYALHAAGDHDDALARLWRLGAPGWGPHTPLVQFLAMVGQLEVHVSRHEFASAIGLLHTVEADPHHSVCPASWEARVLLETGDFRRAIELTAPCLAPGRVHAARTLAYALTVHAAALAGVRDLASADATFQRALSLASVTGLRRHLLSVPGSLLTLLVTRAAAADLPTSSHAVVLDLVALAPATSRKPHAVLSERERVVLERLAAGEPLQQIAWMLQVSPNTVKAQTRSIYRKLGVDSRHGAVQRGRSLGLLS